MDYGPQPEEDRNYCFYELTESACKERLAARDLSYLYESYKETDKKTVDAIKPTKLYPVIEGILKPSLGTCGEKNIPISLHYFGEDKIFERQDTLVIYSGIRYWPERNEITLQLAPFRVGMPFGYFNSMHTVLYRIPTAGKSDEEIMKDIRRAYYSRFLK